MSQFSCLGRMGRSYSRPLPIFPKQVFLSGGSESYLQPWLSNELIPLPGHSRGTHHAQYWLSSGDNQLCLPTSQYPASRYSHQPLWPDGAGRHNPQWVGLTQLLVWVWANQPLVLAKFLIWKPESDRSEPQWVPWVHHQLGSADKQSHWLRLPLEHCWYELSLPMPVCWLL